MDLRAQKLCSRLAGAHVVEAAMTSARHLLPQTPPKPHRGTEEAQLGHAAQRTRLRGSRTLPRAAPKLRGLHLEAPREEQGPALAPEQAPAPHVTHRIGPRHRLAVAVEGIS